MLVSVNTLGRDGCNSPSILNMNHILFVIQEEGFTELHTTGPTMFRTDEKAIEFLGRTREIVHWVKVTVIGREGEKVGYINPKAIQHMEVPAGGDADNIEEHTGVTDLENVYGTVTPASGLLGGDSVTWLRAAPEVYEEIIANS